jgi:glycosyltransferase involved in cell wall biosynthesis
VDGPIGAYRGFDDGADRRIVEINHALADATVLQSRYSLDAHRELGLELRDPVLIPNAADPRIFFPAPAPPPGPRIRLIATSWSDNPNKGAATLGWLDRHLVADRYELTFIGRLPVELRRARVFPPVASDDLAALLREHHVYLAPSLNDPCSNALIEALSCGLPAVFARSGGHPELVGEAGLGFDDAEEIPELLDRLVSELDDRRALISVPSLDDVADRYLAALGIAER